jgi:hypothetical protein
MKSLSSLPNVTLVDLTTKMNVHSAGPLKGWQAKPFSVLLSSFAETILMDADVIFLRDPAVAFNLKSYIRTGTLLFRDRTLFYGDLAALRFRMWVGGFLRHVSAAATGGNRMLRGVSGHEVESGVVVVNKKHPAALQALLLNCALNSGGWKREQYKYVHGDKEAWWMSHEMLGSAYHLVQARGGALGYRYKKGLSGAEYVCGSLYHPLEDEGEALGSSGASSAGVSAGGEGSGSDSVEAVEPFWFNGGLHAHKDSPAGHHLFEMTSYAVDLGDSGEWYWEGASSKTPLCLRIGKGSRDVLDGDLKRGDVELLKRMQNKWSGRTTKFE